MKANTLRMVLYHAVYLLQPNVIEFFKFTLNNLANMHKIDLNSRAVLYHIVHDVPVHFLPMIRRIYVREQAW